MSKGRTQCPFKKTHGQVQTLAFHPTKPFFFVATQVGAWVGGWVSGLFLPKNTQKDKPPPYLTDDGSRFMPLLLRLPTPPTNHTI